MATKFCHLHGGIDENLLIKKIEEYIDKNNLSPEIVDGYWGEVRYSFEYEQNNRRLVRLIKTPENFRPRFCYRGRRRYVTPTISYKDAQRMGLLKYTRKVKVVFTYTFDIDDDDCEITVITAFPVGKGENTQKEPGNIYDKASEEFINSVRFWRGHALIQEAGESYENGEAPVWSPFYEKKEEEEVTPSFHHHLVQEEEAPEEV